MNSSKWGLPFFEKLPLPMLVKSTLPCRTESVSNMSLSSGAVVRSSSGRRSWDSNVNNVLFWELDSVWLLPLKLFSRTRIVRRATHRVEKLHCSSSVQAFSVVYWLSQIANIWLGLQPNSVQTHSCFEQKLSYNVLKFFWYYISLNNQHTFAYKSTYISQEESLKQKGNLAAQKLNNYVKQYIIQKYC